MGLESRLELRKGSEGRSWEATFRLVRMGAQLQEVPCPL